MRVDAVAKRWIEILAGLYLAWRDGRRQLRSLIVTQQNQHFLVKNGAPRRDAILQQTTPGAVLATVPAGAHASAELKRMARDGFVIFELPSAKVVARQITVPVQARKFFSGIVCNQVERLSPWPVNSVVHGFSAAESTDDATVINVRVLIAARSDIEAARQELDELGLPADRIVTRGRDAQTPDEVNDSVTLWSRLADSSPERLRDAVRSIATAIAAVATASLVLVSWALVSTASIRADSEDVATRARTLQRQVQTGRTASSGTSLPAAERAWLLKETSISSVILVEVLSRALPASAYVTEIRLEKDDLRITGLAEDAPALLAPLERSGHMTNAHFFAPTARGPDGKLFRFSIEAHLEAHIKLGEN